MALNGSISGNYRNYTITTTWSATQNVGSNYSYITCHHTLYCPYALYIGARSNSCNVNGTNSGFTSPAISTNGGTTHDLGTTYYTVYHNADGTKSCNISTNFKLQATMSGIYIEEINASGTIELNTIPRQANITSAPDFTDEENPTIYYENKAGSSVTSLKACISLTGASDDIAYRDIPKTGTSYTFNLTSAERNVLRNATKNSNTRTVYFYVQTEIGGNYFRNSLQKKLTIVNANPTFTSSNVSYEDTDTSVVAVTKNNQHIVQNKSNLKVSYTSATAKKGATISSYSFSLNGVTQGVTGSSGAVTFGKINSSNNLTLTATVTDSRGNKTSVNKTITILPYTKPNAIVTLNRLNNYEDESYLTVDGSVASVNSKNTMAIKYRYKLSGGSYNNFIIINDNVKQTLTLNKNNEYIFNVVVTDAFNEKFDKEFVLGKGVFPLFIDVEKNSLGINCFPTNKKAIEIAGDDGNNEVIFGTKTGSWTPKLEALSETAPTVTYAYQQGDYVKIGKMVFIAVYLRGTLSKLNGTNNYACITGLPFTPKNYVGGKCAFSLGTIYNALDITDNNDNLMAFINDGLIRLNRYNGAGACPLKVTPSGSYFVIGLSGWYEIE